MAKDNSPGLLSKVAKFVRNPTKDWTELDQPEPEQADSGYSKQALKEMIERKRQNDFVRKREFDHLRKLRRREPTTGMEQDAGRPSFFQSSLPSNPDERATTLKKIDEIEAQMSKQWWKGKQADAGSSTNFPVSSLPPVGDSVPPSRTGSSQPAEKDSKFAITEPSTLNPDLAPDMLGQEFAPTQLVSSLHAHSSQVPSSVPSSSMNSRGGGGGKAAAPPASRMTSGFSSSQLFATELGDGGTDPDLEEAAIRFANGDDLGAESGLMEALRGDNITPESADVWMAALFDLYRATNQQQRFDSVGLDFAQRFGRSPPAWFSMPDLMGLKTGAVAGAVAPATPATTWDCPAELDMMAIIDLRRALREAASPWRLNWARLRAIQVDAGAELGGLFAQWCQQAVSLRFESPGNLEKVLRSFTRSGDKAVALYWWQLLMDALRVMQLQDEFELVALDYCVTYEVSPPGWQDARCEYKQEGQESRTNNQFSDTQPSMDGADDGPGVTADATAPMGLDGVPPVRLELSGEILGDAAPALEKLEVARGNSERLVVSCAKLIRVDFSAAGSILNWVAQRQNEGCHVQFRDVHRLVAAFFNVIGINEHARIVPRTG